MEMTIKELREFIQKMPDDVILVVEFKEDEDGEDE